MQENHATKRENTTKARLTLPRSERPLLSKMAPGPGPPIWLMPPPQENDEGKARCVAGCAGERLVIFNQVDFVFFPLVFQFAIFLAETRSFCHCLAIGGGYCEYCCPAFLAFDA